MAEEKMSNKIADMSLKKRLKFGYQRVIKMMVASGVLSLAVIIILFVSIFNYIKKTAGGQCI